MMHNSRSWQNIQHVTGGIYSIVLILTGVMAGKSEYWWTMFFGLVTFTLARISSEVDYQKMKSIIKERK